MTPQRAQALEAELRRRAVESDEALEAYPRAAHWFVVMHTTRANALLTAADLVRDAAKEG